VAAIYDSSVLTSKLLRSTRLILGNPRATQTIAGIYSQTLCQSSTWHPMSVPQWLTRQLIRQCNSQLLCGRLTDLTSSLFDCITLQQRMHCSVTAANHAMCELSDHDLDFNVTGQASSDKERLEKKLSRPFHLISSILSPTLSFTIHGDILPHCLRRCTLKSFQ